MRVCVISAGLGLFSYIISAVCAIGWCDAGVMGYPDVWRSKTAETLYGVCVVISTICIVIAFGCVIAWGHKEG